MTTTPNVTDRIRELFTLFKLPTLADQATQRFRDGGYDDALAVLLETLEAEYDERKVRRCERLLRASHCRRPKRCKRSTSRGSRRR
jgi:hypothetical protein